ncbi:TRAPP subunit TRS31 NDAI_0H00970 [Naumovozyma dairenensis CBS 421]|uniref:Trafficking protein particle complex subunit n=1 Tax=Naumovozyma dairenensis (strain ATCC 10597 / BCRC 20456 / CBS 421 / NBRC 0211 / NRRL Y-12639) TaxID=1071378 RepID=G0WER0_NAUDC|nr:hypothetical protein NDAI_0H00970 [Naumovozyma dairenensis CBS 421]CCD26271.1 hypothetical protein NDAI_0H00970 [Naumovozyma dairenensis CBS 421]
MTQKTLITPAENSTTITQMDTSRSSRLYTESLMFKKDNVSLSAMTFLYQEMISYLHQSSTTMAEFEKKLSNYGESIGLRLLELLNFRASLSPKSFIDSSSSATTTTATTTTTSNITTTSATTGTGTAKIISENRTRSKSTTSKLANDTRTSSNSALRDHNTHHHHHHHTLEREKNLDVSLCKYITKMRRRDLKILDILQFIHGTLWSYLFNHVSDDLVKSSERANEYMIIDNSPVLTQFIPNNNNASLSCNYFVCGIIKGFLLSAGFPCSVNPHTMSTDEFDERLVYLIQFDQEVLEREALRA